MGQPFDFDNFNRPACHVTITARGGRVLSAACNCGRLLAGRGKTAEASAAAHIKAWGAPYEVIHV